MTTPRPDDEAIFHAARGIADPERRRGYVHEACGGNETVIAHIEALLAAAAAPDSLLDSPPLGPAADDTRTGPSGPDADEPLDFLDPSDKPDSIGRLGHYEIQGVVGRGGMGVVLKAFDENLHRMVAVKVMTTHLAASATARQRFTREARAQAAVTHDHVVTIHAVEGAAALPYIVMQFVAGVSLQDRLDRTGPLQLHEVLRIGMQAASGLAAAHAQGLVHRDVKPANILLENGVERVKLTDFGLARAADDASLTQSGMIAGTPQYMSPEQAEGKPVDARSDLFSLGSVLYAMCTGRPPFRASTNMAVLKRVCEDAPAPVRQANPEAPDWLCAIVAKLHAKDPADRYQSAAEVAEVLGRHLAQVQHPSQMSEPVASGPKVSRFRRPRRGRWAVAAAVLVLATAGLGMTEAAGVTKVRATVIRIFTPDGTLVVETDDPAVKVTVEGDGDLVITGAGPQEVRLRAGSYRLRATKDGKPVKLDHDLVTITRGDTQVVRVRLEDEPPTAVVPRAEGGAFVRLGSKGVAERKFDTLAEAVQSASDGDTIEIRGNGPFVCDGVTIGQRLVIRAGEGYTPSITLSQAAADKNTPLFTISASLVLEGLELRRVGGADGKVENRLPRLLNPWHPGALLQVANCRLILKANQPDLAQGSLFGSNAKSVSVLNSVLSFNGSGEVGWRFPSGGRCNIENCVSAIGGIGFGLHDGDRTDVSIRVRGNTFVGRCMSLTLWGKPNLPENGEAPPPIALNFSRNVTFHGARFRDRGVLYLHQYQLKPPFSAGEAETLLPRLVGLTEQQNLYSSGTKMLRLAADWNLLEGTRGQDLADWNLLWKQKDTGSLAGDIRFQGGDLTVRALTAPEKLTAEDFRLRPDSAGYHAGKDGKDLGADVDLVGPGPAYERWKKTPDYQTWLEETGQAKK
jgi:hypothetical protein